MASLPDYDPIARQIFEAAARENAATSKKKRFSRMEHKRYLGMSQIGGPCARRLWYDFRSFTPKPLEGRMALLFDDGSHYEAKIIKYLRLAGYRVDHTGYRDQLEFKQHGSLYCGHCDGVIYGVTQRLHILECKSANKKKFESFQKLGVRRTYPVYYCQCQCYMGYSGLDRALVVVYCKDDSQIYTERIPFNRNDFRELHDRAYWIITANRPPAIPFDDPQCFECTWCDYRIPCRMPEEAIIMVDDRVCGSCWYLWWRELKPCCLHPSHPFFIETWGVGCDDWSYLFDKELRTHQLHRKPKVPLDQVTEAARYMARSA